MRGDDQTAEVLFARFDARPAAVNLAFPINVADWGGDFSMAVRLAQGYTRSANADPIRLAGHLNLARLFVAHGRWRAAEDELEWAADVDLEQTRMTRAVLVTLPFLSIPRDDLASVMEELQRWAPPVPEQGSPPERAYDQHARLYFMGLLASKLGDETGALEYADAIEELGDVAGTADLESWRQRFGRMSRGGRGALLQTFCALSSPCADRSPRSSGITRLSDRSTLGMCGLRPSTGPERTLRRFDGSKTRSPSLLARCTTWLQPST